MRSNTTSLSASLIFSQVIIILFSSRYVRNDLFMKQISSFEIPFRQIIPAVARKISISKTKKSFIPKSCTKYEKIDRDYKIAVAAAKLGLYQGKTF